MDQSDLRSSIRPVQVRTERCNQGSLTRPMQVRTDHCEQGSIMEEGQRGQCNFEQAKSNHGKDKENSTRQKICQGRRPKRLEEVGGDEIRV